MQSTSGHCLCGGVQYRVDGPLASVVACHCSQCRRTSGHFAAMASYSSEALTLIESDSLRWYRSSPKAERGFCGICGSNLFWRRLAGETISITAGTLNPPTHLTISEHIYVADKSDYYVIVDGVPQLAAE